jgi:hypothetical protein
MRIVTAPLTAEAALVVAAVTAIVQRKAPKRRMPKKDWTLMLGSTGVERKPPKKRLKKGPTKTRTPKVMTTTKQT